jgi:hypothetical protein
MRPFVRAGFPFPQGSVTRLYLELTPTLFIASKVVLRSQDLVGLIRDPAAGAFTRRKDL